MGAAAFALIAAAAFEFLDSIPPFTGAGVHFLRLVAALVAGIVLLAVFAASAGRTAVLSQLIEVAESRSNFAALLWLGFLRSALLLLAVLSVAGAWLIAARVSGMGNRVFVVPDAAGFWLVFCPFALIIIAAWSWLYWIITLAPLPAVVRGLSARDSLAEAAGLIYTRPLQLGAIGGIFGVLRLGSLWIAAQAAFMISATLRSSLPAMLGLLACVGVLYCLVSDWLYISRMAAYAATVENGHHPPPARAVE